jgi:hypothetical protein
MIDHNEQNKEEEEKQDHSTHLTELNQEEKEDYGINDGKSMKHIAIGLIGLIAVFAIILSITNFYNPSPKLDTSNIVKVKAKHPSNEEMNDYIYNGINFDRKDGFWYAELKTGNTIYNTEFYYSPREIEDIEVNGNTFGNLFNEQEDIYITFNPQDKNHTIIAVAIGQIDTHFIRTFQKNMIASCANANDSACFGRDIVTCENATDKAVIYVKEAPKPRITFQDNCVLIEGQDWDLIRSAENVLMRAYGILE